MDGQPEMVTIYRSMDASAQADCEIVVDMLSREGIQATMLDDCAPGVPEGAFEVQVRAGDVSRAEGIIAANPLPDEVPEVDPSHDLDLETIYQAGGSIVAQTEVGAIMAMLEANDIMAVTSGESVVPNLPFDIKVARDQAERARHLIAEAQIHGAQDAEEAERESEKHPE